MSQEAAHEALRTEIEVPISDDYVIDQDALRAALTEVVDQAVRSVILAVRPDAQVRFVNVQSLMDKQEESHEDQQQGLPVRRSLVVVVDYVME